MTTPRKIETIKSLLSEEERIIHRAMEVHRLSREEAELYVELLARETVSAELDAGE